MPWSTSDVDKHIKGLSAHQKQVWVAVANSALAKCEKDGGSNCDASAIQQANVMAKKAKKESKIIDAITMIEEAGKMISASNHKKLTDAMQSMKTAIDTIMPLISLDSEEEVTESKNIMLDYEIDPVMKLTETHYQKWELVNIAEAAKTLSIQDSYDTKRSLVSSALRKRAMINMMQSKVDAGEPMDYYDSYSCGCYIQAMYDSQVVHSCDGGLYQCDYSIDSSGNVTLGDDTPVQISYVPVADGNNMESSHVEVHGDLIKLTEKAVKSDGTVKIKVISPGWGSSGYYSSEMLKRDGPKIFKNGLHMYMNHPTAAEAVERPERDLRDLVGVLTSDAVYEENGVSGPGLYADAKVFENYQTFINDAAEHIGVSIVAGGRAMEGDAEGRRGPIINTLEEAYSIDYVTLPGRGGQVLPLLESVRVRSNNEEVVTMDIDPKELAGLRESAAKVTATEKLLEDTNTKLNETNRELARMKEAMIVRDAKDIVASELAKIDLLPVTRERLVTECMRTIPMKDGELDKDALTEAVKNKATEELKYIESISGVTGGRVVGVGVSSNNKNVEISDEDFENVMTEAFKTFGYSDDSAKIAAKGR